jgi:hypothetical protein
VSTTRPGDPSIWPFDLDELVSFLLQHRLACLRELGTSRRSSAGYHHWQGHIELSEELLERLGAEVPQ